MFPNTILITLSTIYELLMSLPQTIAQVELSFYQQEEFSSFCSIDSNPSTCTTHTNLSQSVELALSPLIDQLVTPGTRGDRRKRNVSLSLLLQSLEQAVSQLVNAAEKIAYENDRKVQMKMLSSVNRLKSSAKQFKLLISDPTSPLPPAPDKRPSPRDAARVLLYDLAAVLSVADKLDMKRLHEATHSVESSLESLKSIVSVYELFQQITQFTPVMAKLTRLAKQRQDDLGMFICMLCYTAFTYTSVTLVTSCPYFPLEWVKLPLIFLFYVGMSVNIVTYLIYSQQIFVTGLLTIHIRL